MGQVIEIREPGVEPRWLRIDASVEVGRDCDGIITSDAETSRRHLLLSYADGVLSVNDLGSTNGTTVNGAPVFAETPLRPGDVIGLGATEILVHDAADAAPVPDQGRGVPVQRRPALEELAAEVTEAAIVRYRPGTAGEKAAADYAGAVRRARRRLAGFGSEPWGVRPQICLVDPFPDPADPANLLTSGTIIDAPRGEIWMVVTAESPPEAPERPLALFFGAALPAAAELEVLVEGFGLHLARMRATDSHISEPSLPPLARAAGELRPLMAVSFVRDLLRRGGEEDFLRLLATARPGAVDAAARAIYGTGLGQLEEQWRRGLIRQPRPTSTLRFLHLAGPHLRPHRWREVEMTLLTLLQLAFPVVLPFALQRLVDRTIPSGRLPDLWPILAVLAGALLVSLFAGLRRAQVSASVSASTTRRIRTVMFDRLQVLPAEWYATRPHGDLLSRLLADVNVFEAGLAHVLHEGGFQLAAFLTGMAVLLALSPPLALAVLLGSALVLLLGRATARAGRRRSRSVQEQLAGLVSVAAESLAGHAVVQAFALEPEVRRRFRRAADLLFTRQRRQARLGGVAGVTVDVVGMALRIVVVGLGAWLVLRGRLTLGTFVAAMSVVGQVLGPARAVTGFGPQIQAATGALARIEEVLSAEPAVTEAPGATDLPPLRREIRLAGVSFEVEDQAVLLDVDAVVPAGARVAFVGATGATRAALVSMLTRRHDPTAGAVRYDDVDLRTVTLHSLRARIGVVLQDTFLFDASVRDNIALVEGGVDGARIEAAARMAQVHDFVMTLPQGYDTPLGARGVRLAGSQRQRLGLARALLRDPAVLLLDEATAGLDPRAERMLAEAIAEAARGRTTVAITHRLASVIDYDWIYVFQDGRLVEGGRHERLLERGGVYAELWAEQTGSTAADTSAVTDALRRVPLLAGLGTTQLDLVARSLRELRLEPGETQPETVGRLYLVAAGRAQVLAPDLDGQLVPMAPLGPGEVFGLSAVAGEPTGSVLRALRPLKLLVLDDEMLAGLAAAFPEVGTALNTPGPSVVVPAGGSRLAHVPLRLPRFRPNTSSTDGSR